MGLTENVLKFYRSSDNQLWISLNHLFCTNTIETVDVIAHNLDDSV